MTAHERFQAMRRQLAKLWKVIKDRRHSSVADDLHRVYGRFCVVAFAFSEANGFEDEWNAEFRE